MESGSVRPYRMRKRADQVAQTRRRIVDAAVHLHTTVGPARTTIAGIAGQAGVTRATVYSHFCDDDELFAACSGQWLADHPPPDPSNWVAVADPTERAERALDELYRWFAANAEDLRLFSRDAESMPQAVAQAWTTLEAAWAQSLREEPSTAAANGRRHRALAAHLIAFTTWDSLATRGGLQHEDLVDLGVKLLDAVLA